MAEVMTGDDAAMATQRGPLAGHGGRTEMTDPESDACALVSIALYHKWVGSGRFPVLRLGDGGKKAP